jgi:hypothetical protein
VALGIVCAPPPGLTLETSVLTAVLNLHLGEQMWLWLVLPVWQCQSQSHSTQNHGWTRACEPGCLHVCVRVCMHACLSAVSRATTGLAWEASGAGIPAHQARKALDDGMLLAEQLARSPVGVSRSVRWLHVS